MTQDIAEKYAIRVWDKKDLSAVDEFVSPNVVIHNPLGDFRGIQGVKHAIEALQKAFPDYHVKNLAIFHNGDKVAIQWEGKGTQQQEFLGILAEGKSIINRGVTVYRVKEGKIVEYSAYFDIQSLINQLKH